MPLPRIAGPTRIFDQAQIRRAIELGLGIGGPGQVQFITPDAASAE